MKTYLVTNTQDSSARCRFVKAYTLCEAILKAEHTLKVSRIVLNVEPVKSELPTLDDIFAPTMPSMNNYVSLLNDEVTA